MGSIYTIEALVGHSAGKKYVGQTKYPKDRLWRHSHALKLNKHYNPYLQRYYNKYGKDSLKFTILGEYPDKDLNFWEHFFIKCFNSHKNGFNGNEGGFHGISHLRKECTLKNAFTGEIATEVSYHEFARKHNIDIASIARVFKGEANHVEGWILPNSSWKPKSFSLIGPDNKEYTHYGYMADFCKIHGIKRQAAIGDVLNRKKQSMHGWRLPESYPPQKSYKFINPKGEIIKKPNLKTFETKYGLERQGLYDLLNGKIASFKGWKVYQEATC